MPVDKISQGYKNHIRLIFRWTNLELNNEKDTATAILENAKISIPLEINLKQYTGEGVGNGT